MVTTKRMANAEMGVATYGVCYSVRCKYDPIKPRGPGHAFSDRFLEREFADHLRTRQRPSATGYVSAYLRAYCRVRLACLSVHARKSIDAARPSRELALRSLHRSRELTQNRGAWC